MQVQAQLEQISLLKQKVLQLSSSKAEDECALLRQQLEKALSSEKAVRLALALERILGDVSSMRVGACGRVAKPSLAAVVHVFCGGGWDASVIEKCITGTLV